LVILKKKIENILSPIYGNKNIQTEVTANINLNKKKISENTLYQSKSNNKTKNHNNLYLKKNSIKNPINQLLSIDSKKTHYSKNCALKKKKNENKQQSTDSTTYIHSKKKIKKNNNRTLNNLSSLKYITLLSKNDIGEISKLSVSVIINYKKNEKGIFVPLNTAEIKKIKNIVCSAIGFSKNRGDIVNVENILFATRNKLNFIPKILLEKNHTCLLSAHFKIILLILIIGFSISILIIIFQIKKIKSLIEKNKIYNFSLKKIHEKNEKTEQKETKDQDKNLIIKDKIKIISSHNPSTIAKIVKKWIKEHYDQS